MNPAKEPLRGVTCGFCLGKDEQLQTPKFLPCQHICCLRCLEGSYMMYDMIRCPFCRETYPGVTPESLPSAFLREDESNLCHKCREKKKTGIVLDQFCSLCCKIGYENYQKELAEKKLNAVRYCDQHKESVYTSGCELCYKPLCTDCIHGDDVCSNGRKHTIVSLDHLVAEVKQTLKYLQDKGLKLSTLDKRTYDKIVEMQERKDDFSDLEQQRNLELEMCERSYRKREKDLLTKRAHIKGHNGVLIEDEIFVPLANVWRMRVKLGALLQCILRTEAISGYAKMKDYIHDLLSQEIPTVNIADGFTEDSGSFTESSLEDQNEFADDESESSDSDVIPLEAFQAISQLCNDYSVESIEFSYDPNDSNHILIIGKNAGEIPPNKINKLLTGTRFTASTRETDSAIHTNPMVNQIVRKNEEDFWPQDWIESNMDKKTNIAPSDDDSDAVQTRKYSQNGIKPTAIVLGERNECMFSSACNTCYIPQLSNSLNQSFNCQNGESHNFLPVEDLMDELRNTHQQLQEREEQLMHVYIEHRSMLSEFECTTWDLVEDLHRQCEIDHDQQVKLLEEKYSALKEKRLEKRKSAISDMENFYKPVIMELLKLGDYIHSLEIGIAEGHKVDVVNLYSTIKDDIQRRLSEKLPKYVAPDDFTEDSCSFTESSLEDHDEFADEESESSGSDAIPLEVFDGIAKICQKYSVDSIEFSYDPDDVNHLLIIGKNAGNIPLDEIDELVTDGRFTITPKEVESPVHTVTMMAPILAMKQRKRDGNDWSDLSVDSACELLLHSVDRNREGNEEEELGYLAGPAHMVLDKTQREEFCCADDIINARYDVEKISTQIRFIIELSGENNCLDIGHPPLMCYKYWCSGRPRLEAQAEEQLGCSCQQLDSIIGRMEDPVAHILCTFERGEFDEIPLCKHIILSDILLLSLHPSKAVELWEKFRQRKFKYSTLSKTLTIGRLRKISKKNAEIRIGRYDGQLTKLGLQYKQCRNDQTGCIYHYIMGFHMQFKLNSRADKLVEGDCGHIVFLKQDGNYLPLGMFIGSIKGNESVYRAILIHECLKELELDYPHHLSRVRLINRRFAHLTKFMIRGRDEYQQHQPQNLKQRYLKTDLY